MSAGGQEGIRLPIDGCPNCIHGRAVPHLHLEDRESMVCIYRCPQCGHVWRTWWSTAFLFGVAESRERRERMR